jgi:hypothetical protein
MVRLDEDAEVLATRPHETIVSGSIRMIASPDPSGGASSGGEPHPLVG